MNPLLKSPPRSKSSASKQRGLRLREIVVDGDHRLWTRRLDGSWQWIDLNGFIDERPNLDLPGMFGTARLDVSAQQVRWDSGEIISAAQLQRALHRPSSAGVLVMAASREPRLWFRPLAVRELITWDRPAVADAQTLAFLDGLMTADELQHLFAKYRTNREAVGLRLLDLLCLRSVVVLGNPRDVIRAHWRVPSGPAEGRTETILESILRGDLSTVEREFAKP